MGVECSVDVGPQGRAEGEGVLVRRSSSTRGKIGRGVMGRAMEMGDRGMMGRAMEMGFGAEMGGRETVLPETVEATRAQAYCVPVHFQPPCAPQCAMPPPVVKSEVELAPGMIYRGETVNGVPQGRGELLNTLTKEVIYEGQFEKGLFHGRGKLYHHNVQVKDGKFVAGRFVEGRYIRCDGRILIGRIVNRELEGKGRMILPSGMYIEGEWKNTQPHGKCTVHICKSITDLIYDFDHPDDDTRFSVAVKPDRVFYDNKYYLKDGHFANSNSPVFLFYFNGDVFIGNTTGRNEPFDGNYYRLMKDDYIKMSIGNKLDIDSVITLSCSPALLVKNIDLEVVKS